MSRYAEIVYDDGFRQHVVVLDRELADDWGAGDVGYWFFADGRQTDIGLLILRREIDSLDDLFTVFAPQGARGPLLERVDVSILGDEARRYAPGGDLR